MKAWILDELHSTLRLAEVDTPKPGADQVVVKVRATGLCHSDIGLMEGVIPFQAELPLILGHEASGVIAEVGENVSDWAVWGTR